MVFYGFQKLTLLDYPGKMACTLFTGGCNFRCPFCHNALLVTELDSDSAVIDETDVLEFLKKRQGLLDGVAITGGEPLMYKELPDFMRRVRELGYLIKLDTNGSYPERLKAIVTEGLADYVAMDIKNSPDFYGETIGLDGYETDNINQSIDFLKSSSVDYEFRTTVVKGLHNEDRMKQLATWIQGDSKYYIQNFKDSGNIISDGLEGFDKTTLEAFRKAVLPMLPKAEIRGE